MAISIAILLIISMSASLMLIPNTTAHSPPWTVISYGYVVAAPQPVGIGQAVSISMWVDYPFPGATVANNIRRSGYTLVITAPDGTNTSQTWAAVTDSTGFQSITYTPAQIGNYTFSFYYAGQNYTWTGKGDGGTAADTGDIFLPCSATTTINVQQEPIPAPIDSYPMPTEYWTRPIEGQNTYWYTIASNWLSAPYIIGASPGTHSPGAFQPYGSAPNSAHIMWTQPIQYGGVVGGNLTGVPGEMYYEGSSYNTRFMNPIIIQGTLFFQEPYGNSGSGGNYVAVNLQTGQTLWSINASATGVSLVPSFGYLYDYESPNQYGVLPNGLLIATTTAYTGLGTVWRGYDPATGLLTNMNVTNVPTGTSVAGPQGEILKYVLTNYGTATNPNWYLAEWNSSLVFGGGNPAITTSVTNWYSGTVNASLPSCFDWNVSISLAGSPTGWAIGGADNNMVPLVDPGVYALLIQGTFGAHYGMSATITASLTTFPANVTCISLNQATLGKSLWAQSYPQAPNNLTRTLVGWDPANGVFMFEDKETGAHWGYSLATGNVLWGPSVIINSPTDGWDYVSLDNDVVYQGNLYFAPGYNGEVYCYNDSTGDLEWIFGNGGTGNSTNAGLNTAFGIYPVWITTMADGKIYLQGDVHSPNSPLWKGQQLYCLNATTGTQIWSIFNYPQNMYGGVAPVADGILVAFNGYDSQLYAFGQGPTQTTVQAPLADISMGQGLVIRGTVIDTSAGTQQLEQKADFPTGVPAVSDASQSAWMEYVYMQKPKPANSIGVPVQISVTDSNGNSRIIGTATTDASGMYTLNWKPDITGNYTVTATFTGSQSYWGSSAETSFSVDSASPTPAPTQAPQQSTVDQYFVPAVAGIIVAIAIVGVVLALLVLRKRP
jgi:outer membrane protein assembly factor BamB